VLAALLAAATLYAPKEAVLGNNMRWVYLHVSFTWAGMALIYFAALGGAYLIWKPTAMRHSLWVVPVLSSGLTLFGIGFCLSLVASWTSWGGILWMEPRVQSSIAILVAGFTWILIVRAFVHPRVVGTLAIFMAVGLGTALGMTGRVFHPGDPIGESTSTTIRLTFYAFAVVAIAIGVVLAMLMKGAPATAQKSPGRPSTG